MNPGFYYNMPAAKYHADCCPEPSLSSGVARTIVAQSPAHAYLEHVRLGGKKSEPTTEMILGGYVHGLSAKDLSDFEVGNFDDYKSKAAQAWRDGVFASGKIPILEHKSDLARLVYKSLREKVAVGCTRNPFETGKAEVTAVWQEDDFWFRARYDNLDMDSTGFADVWDWKTTEDASVDAVLRRIIDKGYHIQAAHYIRGIEKLAPEYRGRVSFIFGFVETKPPFAVRRVCLTESFLMIGRNQLERAIREWRTCLKSNMWPDYSGGTVLLEPPSWYSMRVMEGAA